MKTGAAKFFGHTPSSLPTKGISGALPLPPRLYAFINARGNSIFFYIYVSIVIEVFVTETI